MPPKTKSGARKPQGKMHPASTHASLFFNVLGRILLHSLEEQRNILESLLVDLERLFGIVNATLDGAAALHPKAKRKTTAAAPPQAVAFAAQPPTPDGAA